MLFLNLHTHRILFWVWNFYYLSRNLSKSDFFNFDWFKFEFHAFWNQQIMLISSRIWVSHIFQSSMLERDMYATNAFKDWKISSNFGSYYPTFPLKKGACQLISTSYWILVYGKEKERFCWKILMHLCKPHPYESFSPKIFLLMFTQQGDFANFDRAEICGQPCIISY